MDGAHRASLSSASRFYRAVLSSSLGTALSRVAGLFRTMAVAAFLDGAIPFPAIATTCSAVLDRFLAQEGASGLRDLEDVLEADAWGRAAARERIPGAERISA